jgi:hypothetical protein
MVYEKLAQYGPLPLRILAGVAFIIRGLPKLSRISIEWNVLKREIFPKGKQAVLQQLQKLQR